VFWSFAELLQTKNKKYKKKFDKGAGKPAKTGNAPPTTKKLGIWGVSICGPSMHTGGVGEGGGVGVGGDEEGAAEDGGQPPGGGGEGEDV